MHLVVKSESLIIDPGCVVAIHFFAPAQEDAFRGKETFNGDDKWTTGAAADDIFSAHRKELKGNNDLLTVSDRVFVHVMCCACANWKMCVFVCVCVCVLIRQFDSS